MTASNFIPQILLVCGELRQLCHFGTIGLNMTNSPRPDNSADTNRVSRTTHNIGDNLRGQQSQVEHGSLHALYDELHSLRAQEMRNGVLDVNRFNSDASQVMEQLHKDGFLPRMQLVVDGRNNLGLVDEKGQFVGRDTPLQPGDVPALNGPQRQVGALDAAPPVVPQSQGDLAAASAAAAEQSMHRASAEGPAPMDGGGPHRHGSRHHRGGGHHSRGHHGRHGRRGGHQRRGRGAAPEGDTETGDRDDQAAPAADGLPNIGQKPSIVPTEGAKPWESSGTNGTVPVPRLRSAGELKVTGASTITPQKIDEVLAQYHSPAYGRVSGQEVYDKSLQHGINPAIALAFYVCESSAGTKGKGARNNSWGNIRTGDARNGYKSYDNIHTSLDHFLNLLSGPGYVGAGKTTLGTIIPKYAPRSDGNDTGGYMNRMYGLLKKWES